MLCLTHLTVQSTIGIILMARNAHKLEEEEDFRHPHPREQI